MAWKDSPFNPKNWGGGSSNNNSTPGTPSGVNSTSSSTNSGDSIQVSQPLGGRGSESLLSKPKNSALDDLQMDLGLKPKNDVYYRDLADRSARSQDMMERMQSSSDNDSSPAPKEEVKEEAPVEEEVSIYDADIDRLTQMIDDLSKQISSQSFDRGYVSGPAEQKAVDIEEKGQKGGTVLTAPRGIVDAEDMARLRKKRSLLAG
jgi:hypothetical protein